MLQLPWYSTWSFCKPCLGTSASHISQLVIAPFQQTFFLMSLCDSAKPGSTHRVKQPVPCLIYSCHPLIYKFHDAIKIKTLSFVLQYLLFTCPTLCCSGNSPPTCSSPSSCVACGLWSRYCLGNQSCLHPPSILLFLLLLFIGFTVVMPKDANQETGFCKKLYKL